MIKIHVFHTGSVIVDRGIPYKDKNPLAPLGLFRGKDKKVELPVSAYLIEHPKGNVLLDTGWSSRYVTQRPHRFLGLLDGISTPVVHQGDAVDEKLAALGLRDADLDYIVFPTWILTIPAAWSICGGPNTSWRPKRKYADSEKYFFRYVKANWAFAQVEPFGFSETGVGPVGKSFDLFGDGSIVFANTPGHTHGLVTTLVTGADGKYAALAGDTFYTQQNLTRHVIPGFTVSRSLAEKSLAYMLTLAADPDCVALLANHDPEVKEQIITL